MPRLTEHDRWHLIPLGSNIATARGFEGRIVHQSILNRGIGYVVEPEGRKNVSVWIPPEDRPREIIGA